jgi:putative endonuclease
LFYVYILYSQSLQRYYVGLTESVEKRLKEHNTGKSKSTRTGVPWKLVHMESFQTRSEAMQQEQKIKAHGIGRYFFSIRG